MSRVFTTEQKRKAIERELRYRRHVYARRVTERKMTQSAAEEQIGVMEAIAADYRQIEQRERLL